MTRNLIHDHEWAPETAVAEWDQDVFVTWDCSWVEITGSTHSERWDETFYEEGAKCCATKRAVYELMAYVGSEDGPEAREQVYEELYFQHRDKIEETMAQQDPYDPCERFTFEDLVPGVTVVAEMAKTYVDEDWC